jgi:uncharacterized protein
METSAPLQQKERIFILDAIRGIALCGILILNIGFFGSPYIHSGFNLNVFGETSMPNIISWYTTNFLLEGSFRALFSMLFGAGSILILSRLTKNTEGLAPADIFYRRMIWLLIFGLINAHILLWPGDILYTYAICGLFIFPLRNLSPRLLIGLATFFMLVVMFKGWLHDMEKLEMREKGVAALAIKEAKKDSLSDDQKGELEKWQGYLEKQKVGNIKKEAVKEIEKMTAPSYSKVWSHISFWNVKIETYYFYEILFFDAMIFILLGMAFHKLGILTGEKSVWWYALFVLFGYGLGFGQGYYTGHAWRQSNYDFFEYIKIQSPHWMLLYQPHRLLVALGHLGVVVILWKVNLFNWLLKPFARVGQMAFTNYLMQTMICSFIFYGYGLGYYGKFERYELWYFVGGVWLFQIIFSVVWMKLFSMGPLEWIWKSLTYWKIQSISKE